MAAASAAPQESRAHTAAVAAEQAELQRQRWAQWGETSLMELLHKDSHFEWNFVCTRDGIEGYSATLPPNQEPGADGQAVATTPAERLDYCVKSEATIDMDPATLAAIYMNVDERHKWHSACQDSRLVEEIWPNTMRIAIFTYRTELPVFPRGYCALIHRASHRLPDGRTQLVITDRSVSHPAMPASRHFIFMTVYPSGMLITPVQQGERTVSHVKLISHFHLRGTISPSLLQRIRANRMLEACCFNYLNEFRNHVRTCYQRAPEAPLPPPVVIKQDDEAQRPGEDQHLRPMACEASASDASHDCSRSDAAEALIQAASAAY